MQNAKVLARINLDALLSNLEIMARDDAETSSAASSWNGSITFAVGFSGPRTTLEFSGGRVKVFSGKANTPGMVLFFPNEQMLNNMFSGQGIGFPIPIKGITKIKGLLTFMKLAKRMEEILKGDNPPQALKAKLMLNTISKAMAIVANYDPGAKPLVEHAKGVAELGVKDGYAVNIEFSGVSAVARGEHADDPDFKMEFGSNDIFLDLTDDKVDIFAAVCLLDLALIGDLHLAEATVNPLLDRIGLYLQ